MIRAALYLVNEPFLNVNMYSVSQLLLHSAHHNCEISVFPKFLKNALTFFHNFFFKMKPKKLSLRVAKRVQIKTLYKVGKSPTEIAKILKCCKKTVYNNIKRKICADKKKPRRSVKCTPTTNRVVKKHFGENPNGLLRKCARVLNFSDSYENREESISREIIQRHLNKTPWGKTAYKMRPVHILTKKNIKNRLNFGKIATESVYCTKSHRGHH
jgi:hypothetical protein